jgi:hypothetical protein
MTPRRHTGLALVPLLLSAAAVLTGCSSAAGTQGGDHVSPAQSTASVTPSAAVSSGTAAPSASTAASTAALPSLSAGTRPLNPPPSGSPNCLSGTVQVVYPSGDNPLRSVCVHVGSRIEITLRGAQGYPWRPVASSAPQVVGLTADSVSAGTVDATTQALAPGSAVLSATTRAAADPTGPMTKRWQLTVTVVP